MNDWVTVSDVKCLTETEAAILVETDDGDVWVPKSQLSDESEVQGQGDHGELMLTEWFARKIGLT